MPFIFRISANLLRSKNIMTVGTCGYHETNMLKTFWITHNQDIQVLPLSSSDELVYSETAMLQGFPMGAQEVVFEPLEMLL